MRLIDADKLKNVFEGYSYTENPNPHFPLDMVKKDIDEAPTVEAKEVVHGEWILRHIGAGHMWECSVCHKRPDIYVKKDTNFCPHCGADMRTSAE